MTSCSQVITDYCNYLIANKGRSSATASSYRFDLYDFFRFMKYHRGLISTSGKCASDVLDIISSTSINDIDCDFIADIKDTDINAYLVWLDKSKGLSPSSRARRVASIKSFFKYCHLKQHIISENPSLNTDSPKIPERQPKVLSLEDSRKLLDVASTKYSEFNVRNLCIIVFFLNCGMRLSELRNIDIDRIKGNTLTVIGKGNKERTVYLNDACLSALDTWLAFRDTMKINLSSKNALFISKMGNRLSRREIDYIVKGLLKDANIDGVSTHKLRHTAATLMYKYGKVDIRSLQEILGHKNISTTQIYTHIDDEQLQEAVASNPLADYRLA